jgi:hypothetical protein
MIDFRIKGFYDPFGVMLPVAPRCGKLGCGETSLRHPGPITSPVECTAFVDHCASLHLHIFRRSNLKSQERDRFYGKGHTVNLCWGLAKLIIDSEGLTDVMCKILIHIIQSFKEHVGFHLDFDLTMALL